MFNYSKATDEELLAHIEQASVQTVSIAKAYHTKRGNLDVVARINACREKLKRKRMAAKLEKLLSEDK